MKDEEIERLLGGYATNTLSDQERQALYEAALEDQTLFNALEDEESLRDLLSDQDAKREIERALRTPVPDAARVPWYRLVWVWGLAGSLAAACVLVAVLVRSQAPHRTIATATSLTPAVLAHKEAIQADKIIMVPPVTVMRPKSSSAIPARTKAEVQLAAGKPSGAVVSNAPAAADEKAKDVVAEASPAAPSPPPPGAPAVAPQTPSQSAQNAHQNQVAIPGPSNFRTAGGAPQVEVNAQSASVATSPMQAKYRMAKRSAPATQVKVVPGDDETLRLSVRPALTGVLRVFQLDAAGVKKQLDPVLQVQPGQDYTVPGVALAAAVPANLLVVLSPVNGPEQTTEVILTPGKAAVVR